MERRIYFIAAICLIAVFAVSCSEEDTHEIGTEIFQQDPIFLSVDLQESQPQTSFQTRTTDNPEVTSIPMMNDGKASDFVLTAVTLPHIGNTPATRRSLTRGEAQDALGDKFKVLAYKYPGDEAWDGSQKVAFTETATETSPSVWSFGTNRYWPRNDSVVRIVGISPTSMQGMTISPTAGNSGKPVIQLEVNTTVSLQEDLMAAISPETQHGTLGGRVKMPFKHLLTCVRFAVGNLSTDCTIDSISVRNVAKSGTFTLGESTGWTVDETSRTDFSMKDIDFDVSSATTQNAIIAPLKENGEKETTMLMMPQAFDYDSQVVEMAYTQGGTQYKVSASLKGQVWVPGTTVTYLLSTGADSQERTLLVSPAVIPTKGGTVNFQVISYATQNNIKTALPWHVVGYSIDNGITWHTDKPAECTWVGLATTSGSGSVTGEMGRLTADAPIAGTTVTTSTSTDDPSLNGTALQSEQLNANAQKGSANNYFDLSTHDFYGNPTLRNTANCYVVNSAGYYKIPLVYGNAIKNGVRNEDVFADGVTKKVHDGDMTTPYLKDKATPTNGFLLWQDTEGLVSQTASHTFVAKDDTDDMYYLYFYIPKGTTLKTGNAVLAASTGSTIMWSWHIWVTPVDVYRTVELTNYANFKYRVMPSFLGFVGLNGEMTTYEGHSMLVKIQQDGGKTAILRVTQLSGKNFERSTRGHAVYYQWGRKDPLVPYDPTDLGTAEGYTGTMHALYPTGGTYLTKYTSGSASSIGYAVQHPHEHYYNSTGKWFSGTTPTDLWTTTGDVGKLDGAVIKTIYDPCPVGFHVPASNTFTGFTTTGGNSDNSAEWLVENKTSGYADHGFYFYTNSTMTEKLFFPNTGAAGNATKNYFNVGVSGYSWLAHMSSSTQVQFLDYRGYRVWPFYVTTANNNGITIWAVAE